MRGGIRRVLMQIPDCSRQGRQGREGEFEVRNSEIRSRGYAEYEEVILLVILAVLAPEREIEKACAWRGGF